MTNFNKLKTFTPIFVILLLWILFMLFNKRLNKYLNDESEYQIMEHLGNQWTTSEEDLAKQNATLTSNQQTQVQNIATQTSKDVLSNMIATQSPLLQGPTGPRGPQGVAGTTLIASGRLVNKMGSFADTTNSNAQPNYFIPQMVVSRTEGTNPSASVAFTSYQDWQLDVNNNLKNRYDGTCLTINKDANSLYLDTCKSGNANQLWSWDNKTNRLLSKSLSTNTLLKCIGLSKDSSITTSIPGCVGDSCISTSAKNTLVLKDCTPNKVDNDQVWSFV